MNSTVKRPYVLEPLNTYGGYGIFDKELNTLVVIKYFKSIWNRTTLSCDIVDTGKIKHIWSTSGGAMSAFKLHTGTSIKDVSDRYEIRPINN